MILSPSLQHRVYVLLHGGKGDRGLRHERLHAIWIKVKSIAVTEEMPEGEKTFQLLNRHLSEDSVLGRGYQQITVPSRTIRDARTSRREDLLEDVLSAAVEIV